MTQTMSVFANKSWINTWESFGFKKEGQGRENKIEHAGKHKHQYTHIPPLQLTIKLPSMAFSSLRSSFPPSIILSDRPSA
jgi:hypothetical protein